MNGAETGKEKAIRDMRKTTSHHGTKPVILLCLMLVSFLLFSDVAKVLALDRNVDFTIANTQSTVSGDKLVTVTIGSSNWQNVVGGIAAFNIKIGYDSNTFEYIETKVTAESLITIGKDEFTATAANKDVLAILYMDNDFKTPIPTEGPLLIINFKVKAGAYTGGYKFKLYGDNVIVDGQLPQFNSVPVYYPSASTAFIIGLDPPLTPTASVTKPPTTGTVTSIPSSQVTSSPGSAVTPSPTAQVTPEPTKPASTSSISNAPPVSYIDLIKSVTERIEKLPERITKDNTSEVKAILKDYNKLPDTEKPKVVNYDKLEKANSTAEAFIAESNKSLFLKISIVVFILVIAALAVTLIVRIRKRSIK